MRPGSGASPGSDAGEELYRLLVEPVAEAMGDDTLLVVVPDRELNYLPFAALRNPATGRYLVEERALVTTPSASLLIAGLEEHEHARRGTLESALIVANPTLDREEFPGLPPLSQAGAMAAEIAAFYPRTEVLIGPDATRRRFLERAGKFDVVHFAGHAISNPRRYLWSRLALASDPAGESGGSLYAYEILAGSLDRTKVMVLAACQTGSGPLMGGEGMMSLARPFLAEGVPSVLVTLTPVDDRTTAELLQLFHGHLAQTGDPAQSLRLAQIDMLQSPDPRRHAPAAWAPFQIVGSPVKWEKKK